MIEQVRAAVGDLEFNAAFELGREACANRVALDALIANCGAVE
jgi:hypothetical protein